MRTLSTFLVSAALCVSAVPCSPARAAAQGLRTVGGFVGGNDSWQTWADHPPAHRRRGIEVGAFAEVATQSPWLSVLTEIAFLQRGARLPLGTGGNGGLLLGDVSTDYLSVAVLPAARFTAGPVRLYGYLGPDVDVHLHTRTAAELTPVYVNYRAQVLVGEIGAGLELRLPGRWSVRGEIRRCVDLTAAYTSAPGDIYFRSTEILIRFGVHPSIHPNAG